MNTSVEAHQQVTRRVAREVFLKSAMSSLICSASSYLFFAFLTYVPSSFFTYSLSKAAFIGLILERNGFTLARSSLLSTPAFEAAWYALSLKRSQPPKTRSSRSASGTNFLIRGELLSVRLPRRIVPSCVSEPMGCALPLRTNSTPAMNVVLTAPIPGKRIPSFPFGGAILAGFSIQLPCLRAISLRMRPWPRKSAYKQTNSIAHTAASLQIAPLQVCCGASALWHIAPSS